MTSNHAINNDSFIYGWHELASISGHNMHELRTARVMNMLPVEVWRRGTQIMFLKTDVQEWAKAGFNLPQAEIALNIELSGVLGRIDTASYNIFEAIHDYDGIKKLVKYLPPNTEQFHGVGAKISQMIEGLAMLYSAFVIADESPEKDMQFLNPKLDPSLRLAAWERFREEFVRGKGYAADSAYSADIYNEEFDKP